MFRAICPVILCVCSVSAWSAVSAPTCAKYLTREEALKCVGGGGKPRTVVDACCFRLSICVASDSPCSLHSPLGVCPLVLAEDPALRLRSFSKHSAPNHTKCQASGTVPGKECVERYTVPPQYCGEEYDCIYDPLVGQCVNTGEPTRHQVADECQGGLGCPEP